MKKKGVMIDIKGLEINSLWFADDSIVLANSEEAAIINIREIREISRKFGLELNESKSAIIVNKGTLKSKEIEGIKVVKDFNYLGIKIIGGTNIFKLHREDIVKKAEIKAIEVLNVIETSCNRLLVGKNWWKAVILPSILVGVGVMIFTKAQIAKLQTIQNNVYRKILGPYRPYRIIMG